MSTLLPPWKPFGLALKDYLKGDHDATLNVITEDNESSEMDVGLFFRSEEEIPELESLAISLCKGRILDVGAGAGAHALILAMKHQEVHALEPSLEAIAVMRSRGLKNLIHQDFLNYQAQEKFDTVLFLMNGIGIAENQANLSKFLIQAKSICSEDGQILLDSSDPAYFDTVQSSLVKEDGSVTYQLAYKNTLGKAYCWLYVGFELLKKEALKTGLKAELLKQEKDGSYLARLKII